MDDRKSPFLGNPAPIFQGTTAYSATLFESQQAVEGDGAAVASGADSLWTKLSYTPDRVSQVQRGAVCLAILQHMPVLEILVRSWYEHSFAFHLSAPWILMCLETLQSRISSRLSSSPQTQAEHFLMEMSAGIFRNTMHPVEPPNNCTPRDYAKLWITENLRWEAVAAFFTAAGIASMASHQMRSSIVLGNHKMQLQPQIGKRMLDASCTCLSFCEEAGYLSDPELWIMSDAGFLSSLVDGDASNITWRLVGDLVSAVTARGLHNEIASGTRDPALPRWLAEMRKRTFAAAYSEDISMAAFTGRPPRLQKRHCAIQLPLDVPMKALVEPGFDFDELASHLDADGWNKQGHIDSSGLIRTGVLQNVIREEVLDFSLSPASDDPVSVAAAIMLHSDELWASYPAYLKDPRMATNPGSVWSTTTCRLNFKYNQILLQRVMLRKIPGHSKDELIRISRETLSELLELLQPPRRHDVPFRSINAPWLAAKYGLPVAGILCLELLLERQKPNRPSPLGQYRSEVIQNLSRLASSLNSSVTPYHGNYQMHKQSRELIKRILDRVLDPVSLDQTTHEAPTDGMDLDLRQQSQFELTHVGVELQPLSEMEFWEKTLPNHPLLREV